jgi:hypothetical protein
VWLYAALVTSVGVGRFYVRHERRLAWLEPDEPAPPPMDAMSWRSGPEQGAGAPTFGPPEELARAPRIAEDHQEGGLGKTLALLNALPRSVEIGIAVAGIVLGSLGIRAEMQHLDFDQSVIEVVGKLNHMTIDARGELVHALKKQGFEVAPDEIQLMDFVTFNANHELAKTPEAFVTVNSTRAGFYHQIRTLTRSYGNGGFEVTSNRSDVWPAPSGDSLRMVMIVAGFGLALLVLAKGFLVSKD